MEVSNELKQIFADKSNIKHICADLESQQKELNKKMYFFRVIEMIDKVGELIEQKVFEHNYIDYVKIYVGYHEDVGNKLSIKFFDREDEDIPFYFNMELEKLSESFSKFNGVDIDNTGSDLDDGMVEIKLNKKYKQKFLDVFFSKELQLVLEKTSNYVKLENELGNTSKQKPTKMKV